ncbi:MAG: aminotransferase class III-fold pyridoxal phosphate-dependent enzyme [Candidatus Omnitrophota bacterium]
MNKGQTLYKKAKKLIPGGTQLFSKNPENFLPELWPAYYEKAKGCNIWGLDGKKYRDMGHMGIGACILGYADKDVDGAVKRAVQKGSMTTLNCYEEVELAELLCDIHPWAKKVRYARTGGEAMTVAVRVARTKTKKDIILFCGYHGWHDWYLSANLADDRCLDGHLLPGLKPAGVPRGLKGTSLPFSYNDINGFTKLIERHKGKIAAVVMEPIRNYSPDRGFLETIREAADDSGAILIFDEITAGWRLNFGGAHLKFGVDPDIAVFAKAISNGYPMAAIIGKKDVMDAAEETFISSTYWTERIGPVAALATIKKLKKLNISAHLEHMGKVVQDGWRKTAKKHSINITISGTPPLGHFSFYYDKPLVLKTLFTQEMLKKGFLAAPAFYASYAHKEKDINEYLKALDSVFRIIASAAKSSNPKKYLNGPVCHSGFKRLA